MSRKIDLEERLEWRAWTTPKGLRDKPVHRWFLFPHSYTSDLVHTLSDEWNLTSKDVILDPFVGAGTTLLAAKEKGIPAIGYDLSPLAVMVSKTKAANHGRNSLETHWKKIQKYIEPKYWPNKIGSDYPELVQQALPGRLLSGLDWIKQCINKEIKPSSDRNFFQLALLATIPYFSRAMATGGWLKWSNSGRRSQSITKMFISKLETMLADVLIPENGIHNQEWNAFQADARSLPDNGRRYSAVISSPPYPNRHDYTRVFGVELMFGFLDWEETRKLRYQSFHSHPESKPIRADLSEYRRPAKLNILITAVRKHKVGNRLPNMLDGYFQDMFLCLKELNRVCQDKAKIAFVLGNAQYFGHYFPVDEFTAEIGEQAGLKCEKISVARYRGNSAQQMAKYGRNPSRESVIIFKK